MAEDDNLVLRLLREIRDKQAEDSLRLVRLERQFEELKESAIMAVGWAGHAVQVVGNRGERFDLLRDQIEAPRRRVTDLEAHR